MFCSFQAVESGTYVSQCFCCSSRGKEVSPSWGIVVQAVFLYTTIHADHGISRG